MSSDINKVKKDIELIFNGNSDLREMERASVRINKRISQVISAKAKSTLSDCIEPTPEETDIANAIGIKLTELENERAYELLEESGEMLTITDVKKVIQGMVLFVIEAQMYDCVTRLDNRSLMFEDYYEPLGYFHGEKDNDIACVGSGSDVWYIANAKTLNALNK